ncbi:MAG: hypothetical protein Q9221_006231 [Calogaya cf. arnoldii]
MFKTERPAIKGARGTVKKQRQRVSVACTYCRKRRTKCKPLNASNTFESDQETCVQCAMDGKDCVRSRMRPVARCFHPQKNLLHLPPVLPQRLPETYEYSEPFGQQHDTTETQSHFVHLPLILPQPLPETSAYSKPFRQQHDTIQTQSQSLTEASSSPKPRAKIDVDDLEKQFEREYYVHENTARKQEETKTDVLDLGIYIPEHRPQHHDVDTQPQRPNVVDTLPSPMSSRLVEAQIHCLGSTLTRRSWHPPSETCRVAYGPVVHPRNGAGHAHQVYEHPTGQVKAPLLDWHTEADTFLHRPHSSPRYEVNSLDLSLNPGFPNVEPFQDLHQTTFEEPRWSGHIHMSYQELLESDILGGNKDHMDWDLFNDDT